MIPRMPQIRPIIHVIRFGAEGFIFFWFRDCLLYVSKDRLITEIFAINYDPHIKYTANRRYHITKAVQAQDSDSPRAVTGLQEVE
jgi:hypothetical protein